MLAWVNKHPFVWKLLQFVILVFLLVTIFHLANRYSPQDGYYLADTLIGLLSIAIALLAGTVAVQTLKHDALGKLHDIHDDPEHAKAIALVWQADPRSTSGNPYTFVRLYWEALEAIDPREAAQLEMARRQVTRFWYRAAMLVDSGILSHKDVYASFGDPRILGVLELLETIKAERIAGNHICTVRPWPPMELLINWYKEKRWQQQLRGLKPQVPARKECYINSLIERDLQ